MTIPHAQIFIPAARRCSADAATGRRVAGSRGGWPKPRSPTATSSAEPGTSRRCICRDQSAWRRASWRRRRNLRRRSCDRTGRRRWRLNEAGSTRWVSYADALANLRLGGVASRPRRGYDAGARNALRTCSLGTRRRTPDHGWRLRSGPWRRTCRHSGSSGRAARAANRDRAVRRRSVSREIATCATTARNALLQPGSTADALAE